MKNKIKFYLGLFCVFMTPILMVMYDMTLVDETIAIIGMIIFGIWGIVLMLPYVKDLSKYKY